MNWFSVTSNGLKRIVNWLAMMMVINFFLVSMYLADANLGHNIKIK